MSPDPVVDALPSSALVLVGGPAGSGKSTLRRLPGDGYAAVRLLHDEDLGPA